VKIVISEGFGLSNARNAGIKNSKGEVIAFIDDDAWADKYWLERISKNYDKSDVYGVGGKIIPVFSRKPSWLSEELYWIVGCTYKGFANERVEIRNPIGANMSFRREAFEIAGLFKAEIGRYGKRLLGAEEMEFSIRLKKLKPEVKIVYDPSAIVYHEISLQRVRLKYALRRAYYEGFTKSRFDKDYLKEEYKYLLQLFKSIPRKALKLRFLELAGIVLVVGSVAFGNFIGKVKCKLGL